MKIASAASAFPKHYYTRKFFWIGLQDFWGDRLKNPLLLARLHRMSRWMAVTWQILPKNYVDIKTWGQANDIWIRVAQELGNRLCAGRFRVAGVEPRTWGAC